MRARQLVGAAAFVFSCTRRRCVGIVFFFFSFFPFFFAAAAACCRHDLSIPAARSFQRRLASVIFKCSHLSSAARRSIEAERKHGGMRLSCAPAAFALEQKQLFFPLSAVCLLSPRVEAARLVRARRPSARTTSTCRPFLLPFGSAGF